jgi:hypothetical protein
MTHFVFVTFTVLFFYFPFLLFDHNKVIRQKIRAK